MSQNNENQAPQRQTDEHIRVLDQTDHIRLRPGMYIGGVDTGAMTRVVATVLFDMVPQIRRQICTEIKVAVLGPKTVQIWSNGQPISITEENVLEKSLAFIGAEVQPNDVLVNHGGGINGLQVANALCSSFKIQAVGPGGLWEQRFEKGHKVTALKRVRDAMVEERWTTTFILTLDSHIFKAHVLDTAAIEGLVFDYAHLCPGLKISFENHKTHEQSAFYALDGLAQYLERENRYKRGLHPAINLSIISKAFDTPRRPVPFELELGFQFLMRPVPLRRSFVNAYETLSHGTHVGVCLEALRDCLLGHSKIIERGDIHRLFEHLTLVVNLWYRTSVFQGFGERRLTDRDFVQRAYEDLSVALTLFFKEHPETLEALEALALNLRPKKTYLIRKPKAAK